MNQMQNPSTEMSRYHYYSSKSVSEVFDGVLMNDRENILFVWFKISKFPGRAKFSMDISRRMAWMNLTFWLNDQSVIHSGSGLIKQKQVNERYGVAWMWLHVCSSIFHSFVKNYSVKCFSGRTFDAKQMNWETRGKNKSRGKNVERIELILFYGKGCM